ncbi:hypothetical protein HN682_07755 [Candidatus Peregrinibacteria bacterium]|jgi:hypothetical protein|nr:hypothetical protein [Candidatus Peregrinibacteria bacterium]
MTTKEQINEIIDLENDLLLEPDDPEIQSDLDVARKRLAIKVDNVDNFVMTINEEIAVMTAQLDVHKKEVERMRNRLKSINKTKSYFDEVLLPMAINTIGTDGILQTKTARYKIYETFGKTHVDPDVLEDIYWRTKTTKEPNVSMLRKICIKNYAEKKDFPKGVKMYRLQKVRRS